MDSSQILEGGLYQTKAEQSHYKTITTNRSGGHLRPHSRRLVSNRPIYAVAITPEDLPSGTGSEQATNDLFDYLAVFNTAPVVTARSPTGCRWSSAPPWWASWPPFSMSNRRTCSTLIDEAMDGAHAADAAAARCGRRRQTPIQALISAGEMPGISVMNELRYNLYTRQAKPYNAVIIKRDITYEQMRQIEEDHLEPAGRQRVPKSHREYLDGPVFANPGLRRPDQQEQYQAAVPTDESD